MTDLLQLFNEETREAYDERALREAAVIAELAHEGIIPPSKLPKLHIVLDGEMPLFVSQAMEALDE